MCEGNYIKPQILKEVDRRQMGRLECVEENKDFLYVISYIIFKNRRIFKVVPQLFIAKQKSKKENKI